MGIYKITMRERRAMRTEKWTKGQIIERCLASGTKMAASREAAMIFTMILKGRVSLGVLIFTVPA